MLAFIFGPPVGFARYVNEMVSRSGRADFIAFVTLIATSGRNYTHENRRHMVVPDYEHADFDITNFWHGVPYDGALPSNIRLCINASKLIAPDFLANPIYWPICSQRLVRVLQDRSSDLQLFDAPLFDNKTDRRITGYSIVNVTRIISCLDFDKSNISYADDSDEIISVIDSVFIESKIPEDAHIFRVAEDVYSVVISDELANDLARERITGLVLLKCLAV